MQIIYKKDSTNRYRKIEFETDEDVLIQRSGLIDGQLVSHQKVCTPKNVGKSNETTGVEQAILEMNSEIAQKLTQGYFKTLQEAETEEVVLPMLAKSYKDEKHKIDWSKNIYCQRKYDGMRALCFKLNGVVTLMSREGKEIITLKHIIEQFKSDLIPG